MIIPDTNLLVYAHNEDAPLHDLARRWWENLLEREARVGIAWVVATGFLRLVTQPGILSTPLRPGEALDRVESWLEQPHVEIVEPGPRHLRIVRVLAEATGLLSGLTTDTHLAALAIEHRAEVHSNDTDFGRFPGLRWSNPIA